MKVQELRELLRSADRPLLEKAFTEIYKQFRKNQKEDIDQIIQNILSGKETEKAKPVSALDFDKLEQEILFFLENAYAQNYFVPNRTIPKNQRPKWRFLLKNYLKELEKIPVENENYGKSVELMTKLYTMLCDACCQYLFSTEDPFRSIGWQQQDLFQVLVKKTFAAGYTRENISALLQLAVCDGLSMESMHIDQETAFVWALKTADAKYMALEEAKKLAEEKKLALAEPGLHSNRQYTFEEAINHLCEIILLISIALAEPDTGIKYFFKNFRKPTKEVVLYYALDLIDLAEDDALWIKVYEDGTRRKIKPRESLQQAYLEKKNMA
ncbi:MAG: hypothetical protein K2N87_06050 [Eubacterium sp.]|nr:hypothetical protein [Eubacterium sp.]